MPAELDKSGGEFNSIKIAKGVYASLGTISKITDMSNHPDLKREVFRRNDGEPFQLCIEVEYEREDGAKWSTRFFGDWKQDTVTGKIKGWKAFANGVQAFFEKFYGDEKEVGKLLNDNWTIGPNIIDPLIGRKFYRISYINGIKDDGKGRYKDWNQIFLEDATIEEMQDAWAKISIRMKSYVPDAVDELEKMKENTDTSFDYGANTVTKEEEEEFEL